MTKPESELEAKVQAPKKSSLTEKVLNIVVGFSVPTAAAVGGYLVTKGAGGASTAMVMASVGALILDDYDKRRTIGYKAGFVIGASVGVVACTYIGYQSSHGESS